VASGGGAGSVGKGSFSLSSSGRLLHTPAIGRAATAMKSSVTARPAPSISMSKRKRWEKSLGFVAVNEDTLAARSCVRAVSEIASRSLSVGVDWKVDRYERSHSPPSSSE